LFSLFRIQGTDRLVLLALFAASNYGSYRVGRALVAGAWAQEREKRATDALAASAKVDAEQAELQKRVADVDKKLQAEKALRLDADRLAAHSLRRFEDAFASAPAEVSGDTPAPGGVVDPSGAIALECAGALRQVDQAYRSLADQTKGLQRYATDVCVSQP
jgi:pilus assembly protein TadC